MNENRIECPLCRTGTYPHFGYTGSGVCDHCGAEWTYDETDTLTDNAMRALWERIVRWIPVTERLPKPGQQVLAAIAGRVWNEENPALIETLDYEQEGFYSWKDDEWPKGVTHWMPLPAPPTDGK